MKILVPIKRVPDYQAKIKVKADGSGIETDGIKWIVNPFDEIAVEEALKLKEAGKATEVVVVSIGPKEIETQLRYTMAMGADRAILVLHNEACDSDLAARVLAKVFGSDKVDGPFGMIIMGKQAIDSDASQTPQLLAAHLGLPQATFASKVVVEGPSVAVTREIDGGLETISVPLPAVISTDLRLNEPRYAPLPGIMKAKKKPLLELPIQSLGVDVKTAVKILRMTPPPKRQGGKKVGSVAELVQALKTEAKVI